MDNNTDEQQQRQHELETASTWLVDAKEWINVANRVYSQSVARPDDERPHVSKLNVAHACVAKVFQLTYNALLAVEAKWPRENGNLEQVHRRLKNDTQDEIENNMWNAGINDVIGFRRNLDYYQHDYMTPSRQYYTDAAAEQTRNHESQISSLAEFLRGFVSFAEDKLTAAKKAAPPRRLNSQEARAKVQEIIQETICASHDGDYIYRGEPENYDKLTSNLYRRYAHHFETGIRRLKIQSVQKEILTEVNGYTEELTDFDALTRLQHYGGRTNLIDFTSDCLIALFFACDGGSDDDGRVILLQKSKAIEKGHAIEQPRILENRVKAQKSVFVCPRGGFIENGQFKVIPIPGKLKKPMLEHLNKHHGISANTIYNDLHGYIKYQELHHSSYDAFFAGLKQHVIGQDSRQQGRREDSEHKFDRARRHYNRALEINPQFATAYHHRAAANRNLGQIDCAINDSSRALELNSNYVEAYFTRGLAYFDKREYETASGDFTNVINGEPANDDAYFHRALASMHLLDWGKVKSDIAIARNLGLDIVAACHQRYPNIADLEDSIGTTLPEDIAEMLGCTESPGETSS